MSLLGKILGANRQERRLKDAMTAITLPTTNHLDSLMPKPPVTRILPIVVGLAFVSCSFAADKLETDNLQLRRTAINLDLMHAKGEELIDQNNKLNSLIEGGNLSEATSFAIELRHKYESQFARGVRQAVFQSQAELDDYRKGTATPFEVIHFGYENVVRMQAYIESEKGHYTKALAILRDLESVAPTSAVTEAELGIALLKVKRSDEALAAYQRSLSLAKRYPVQQSLRPVALRGIGNTFIELNRLDDAERAYRESLKLDPNNGIANHELKYIQGLRR
jgi:tetratricopeptide (TPR) repeat protein